MNIKLFLEGTEVCSITQTSVPTSVPFVLEHSRIFFQILARKLKIDYGVAGGGPARPSINTTRSAFSF